MIYVNGRFLTQPISGVQRYAHEVLGALDGLLADGHSDLGPVEVLVPRPIDVPPPWQALQLRVVRGGEGHVWEQTTLARAAQGGVLVSLGNSGPLLHKRHILCLHDAHLYDMPETFSPRYRLWHGMVRPRLARRAAGLITVSNHSAERLAHHLGVTKERFTIISNSANHILRQPDDTSVPARYGLTRGGYLLSVGNQSPNKNLAALVKAHAKAGANVPPLALIGGSVPGVTSTAVEAGPVHLLGRVPDADLRSLYEGAAAFVFPSLNEGFGIPPLEAMKLGVPVLCARSGAMPDVLQDAPIWFDPRSHHDMTRALISFAQQDDAARLAMREKGSAVAAQYSWRNSARLLANEIAKVSALSAKPKPSPSPQAATDRAQG